MNDREIRDQVTKLHEALAAAKEKLLEQREMLEQLTSPPHAYATVVALNQNPKDRLASLNDVGTRVRLRKDSDFAHQNSNEGTIISSAKVGWVKVKFDDGYQNGYRIGIPYVDGGTRDLEIVSSKPPTATIVIKGEFAEVLVPSGLDINPGDSVTVAMETMQIVDITTVQVAGPIGYLRRKLDDTFSEIDYESSVRVVFNGRYPDSLEKGDRVVLDSSASVVVRNLGKEDDRFRFSATTGVTWDDIGGLEEAKKQMIEAVELPHRHPELFKYYHKQPIKGVMLYGPPGCGKTMLGKATATALAAINGSDDSTGFIYVKGPEILERYVGVAEASIRQIFEQARKHKQTYGYPAVVFIDEADAILSKRGSGISSDVERTIVPMFLAEMDGLEDSGALVILATNRSDTLDPAIVRDGRVDRKIKIDRPTKEGADQISLLNLKRIPLSNGYTHKTLSKVVSSELFAPTRVLYEVNTKSRGQLNFTLAEVINGGMVVSVIDQATSIAIERDMAKGGRPQGLCKDDLIAAVNAVEIQNRDVDHTTELDDFVHDFRNEVVSIRRHRSVSA